MAAKARKNGAGKPVDLMINSRSERPHDRENEREIRRNRRKPHPTGRGAGAPARRTRRLALFHRPHPHALDRAEGLPEERPGCPGIRDRLYYRGRPALGKGPARRRDLLAPDRALLDGPGTPRPRGADDKKKGKRPGK